MAEHTPLWHGTAVARAVHAIKWAVCRRYMPLEALAEFGDAGVAEPAVLLPAA